MKSFKQFLNKRVLTVAALAKKHSVDEKGRNISTVFTFNPLMKQFNMFGSGYYLIVSMTHNIKLGGLSTTTMDCVSVTTGSGIV